MPRARVPRWGARQRRRVRAAPPPQAAQTTASSAYLPPPGRYQRPPLLPPHQVVRKGGARWCRRGYRGGCGCRTRQREAGRADQDTSWLCHPTGCESVERQPTTNPQPRLIRRDNRTPVVPPSTQPPQSAETTPKVAPPGYRRSTGTPDQSAAPAPARQRPVLTTALPPQWAGSGTTARRGCPARDRRRRVPSRVEHGFRDFLRASTVVRW